jgi:hypothetical protein
MNRFGVFPVAHREGARAATVAAFGAASIGDILALMRGATTASGYRVEVGRRLCGVHADTALDLCRLGVRRDRVDGRKMVARLIAAAA